MTPAPLHQLLQALATAHRNGASLAPLGAQLDPDGQLTIHTDRGPVHLWLHSLQSAAAGAVAREEARLERLRDRLPLPVPVPAVLQPAPATTASGKTSAKRAKAELLPSWSAHRIPVAKAPKRAVGNFTTPELRQRTIDELRANLATAQASGCDALAKVMAQALATAVARQVDAQ